MIEKLIRNLFPSTYECIKLKGRYEGWRDHETLIFNRAKNVSQAASNLVWRLMQ